MKCLFILPFLLFSGIFATGDKSSEFIDPTGTYILTGIVKKNRIVSHSGEIRALLLTDGRIALCFYINKGFPNYESGALLDTLPYEDNVARYIPSADTTCTIFFKFTFKTAEIVQLYSNPHSGCGFASGVLTSSVFRKTSWDKPLIQDLSLHGTGTSTVH